eukprot:scaffold3952_cov116-Isochrysis_galbana.AAC.10
MFVALACAHAGSDVTVCACWLSRLCVRVLAQVHLLRKMPDGTLRPYHDSDIAGAEAGSQRIQMRDGSFESDVPLQQARDAIGGYGRGRAATELGGWVQQARGATREASRGWAGRERGVTNERMQGSSVVAVCLTASAFLPHSWPRNSESSSQSSHR